MMTTYIIMILLLPDYHGYLLLGILILLTLFGHVFCLYANIAYHNHQPKSALKSPTRRRDTGYPQSEGLLLYGFTWRKTFTRTARFEKLKLPLSAKHQPWAKHPHSPKRVNIKIILLVTRYPRIASVTTRRAGKSEFRLLGIVITQRSHIFER